MARGRFLTFLTERLRFQLGMDVDNDYLYKKPDSYAYALNICHISQEGNTARSLQDILGTEFAASLGSVQAQNKVYRIYVDVQTNAENPTLNISTPNGVLLFAPGWIVSTGNLVATYNAAKAALQAVLASGQTGSIGNLVTTSTTSGYFTFSLTTVPGWDYQIISLTSGNPNVVPLTQPLVVQEAVDTSLAGVLHDIGNEDLEGDVIIWSTPQTELPSTLNIVNVSASPTLPLMRVTLPRHGLLNHQRVVISGVQRLTLLTPHNSNGQWIIQVVDPDNFDLLGSVFSQLAVPNTGVVGINTEGVGEIGVAQKNDNDQTWSYTPLLRTKEFNFRTKRQPKVLCERNSLRASFYWTDNYNVPRKMYYFGPYIANGALSAVSSQGQYEFGSIAEEIRLPQANANAHLRFDAQLQSGGNLPAGDFRYCFRLLAANLAPTLISDPTNLINVFQASLPTPAASIFGNNAGDITGKINQLVLSGITPNLYKYVELIAIYYNDGVPTATIVRRDLLTQNPIQVIQHTGFETNVQNFDLAQLLEVQPDILLALNITAVNNRCILGNITTSDDVDLTDFFRTLKHTLIRTELTGILSKYPSDAALTNPSTLRAGEYQLPSNLNQFSGHQLYEAYRYSGKVIWKTGGVSQNFWIDDVRFDMLGTNVANPFNDNRRNPGGGLPSFHLTDATGETVYNFGIQFTNIDWNYSINGVPIKNLVEEIRIERVEMNDANREVIGSGICVQSYSNNGTASSDFYSKSIQLFGGLNRVFRMPYQNFAVGAPFEYSEFYWATGVRFDNPFGTPVEVNPTYAPQSTVTVLAPRILSLYVPDIMFGLSEWNYAAGDQIIGFGQPQTMTLGGSTAAPAIGAVPADSNEFYNNLREFTGYFGINHASFFDVQEKQDLTYGGNVTLATLANVVYTKKNHWITDDGVPGNIQEEGDLNAPPSPVAVLTAPMTPLASGIADFGVQNILIYRQKANKFGDITGSKYVPTGAVVTSASNSTTVDVYGGDVLTQKTWFRQRSAATFNTAPSGVGFTSSGLGGGMAFYSQNHVNSQMINRDPTTGSGIAYQYPFITEEAWLNQLEPLGLTLVYNHGYDTTQGISSDEAFDPNLLRSSKQPGRLRYSDQKPEDAVADNYTSWPPLNAYDLMLVFGPNTHLMNFNGQLMTWQPGHFEFQYFDATGLLVTDAQQAVLGNAGVMAQRGTALSTYGTIHGFSVIKGKTAGGKDMVAWIDTTHGKCIKHDPSQGTTVISDIEQFSTFFLNNFRFAANADTPADGQGIHGIYVDQKREFWWTVRAWKDVPKYGTGFDIINVQQITPTRLLFTIRGTHPFQPGDTLNISGVTGFGINPTGQFVAVLAAGNQFEITFNTGSGSYGGSGFVFIASFPAGIVLEYGNGATATDPNFHQLPNFYRSLVANNTQPPTGTNWELIPKTDINFYNVFTLAYNEEKNKFTTFYSPLPKIYAKRGKSILSPRPVGNENKLYEHFRGQFLTWYTDPGATPLELSEDGHLVLAFGKDDTIKMFHALMFSPEETPVRVDCYTASHHTFMLASDFEDFSGDWGVAIKNDTHDTPEFPNPTNANDQDTSKLWGPYLLVDITFEKKKFQKITSAMLKYTEVPRADNA